MKKEIWDKVYKPPTSALKTIRGGRLSGMTDINPQWRYEAATDVFGPCGVGWKFNTKERWIDMGPEGEAMAFVVVEFFFKYDGEWSDPIEGTGGSALIAKEKSGLRANDEAYKMATTDALGTAMKMLGFGGAIYAGKYDGSKYKPEDNKEREESEDLKAFKSRMNNCKSIDELLKWKDANQDIIKSDLSAVERDLLNAAYSHLKNRLELQEGA